MWGWGYILLGLKAGEIAFLVQKEEAHTVEYLHNFHYYAILSFFFF